MSEQSNNKNKYRKVVSNILNQPYVPPKRLSKPELSSYGLNDNIINQNKEKKKQDENNKVFVFRCVQVGISILILLTSNMDAFNIFIAIFFPFVVLLFYQPMFINVRETDIDKKLREYEYDKYCYKWWMELYPQKRVSAYWFSLSGYEFEKSLAEVFLANGYNANITQKSSDGGVDIILSKNNSKIYVQCKAFKGKAGVAIIRELYGVMQSHKINYGIVACLGGFTKGASDFAFGKNIRLIDVNDIIKMVQNGI